MPNIDQRVVQMKFDNAAFESGVQTSLTTLDKLKNSITNMASTVKSAGDFHIGTTGLEGMSAGVDALTTKFSALQVAGVTALATIAHRATDAGLNLAKSLTVAPVSQGFADYNTKLTSVQTIMNATGANIQTVSGYFSQLDHYADKTIFNLTDMTSAFAKFTNAGLDMKTSVPAIKGIANMTALAGQGADAAQIAFYNLSQSIAGGFLTTTDFKSLNLANVATKEWKNQIIQGALAAGTLKKSTDGLYHIPGSKKAFTDSTLFTEGLSEQWATTKVLTKVLGDYGDTTTAIGRKAQAAAQNVKSLPQLMTTVKEAIGTTWTDTFEIILGNVNQSTKLFTTWSNILGKFFGDIGDRRNQMLREWSKAGGRFSTLETFKNIWKDISHIIGPIKEAFHDIFPAMTGVRLAKISRAIELFTAHLILGKDSMDNLRRTFRGLFAVLHIFTTIIGQVIKGFFGVFGVIGEGTGGLLAFTATIGDALTKVAGFITKTHAIEAFFAAFMTPIHIMRPLIKLIAQLAIAFGKLFHGDFSGFGADISKAFDGVKNTLNGIVDKFTNFGGILGSVFSNIQAFFSRIASGAQQSGNTFLAAVGGLGAKIFGALAIFGKGFAQKAGVIKDAIASVVSGVEKFFFGIGASGGRAFDFSSILDGITDALTKLKDAFHFGDIFSKFNDGASSAASGGASALAKVGHILAGIFKGLFAGLKGFFDFAGPFLKAVGDFFTVLIQRVTEFVKHMNLQDAVAIFNTGLLIVMVRTFHQFFGGIGKLAKSGGGMLNNISGSFKQLTNTLQTMQNSIRAKMIISIAIAIGILTASLFVLSKIPPQALGIALGAVTAMFIQIAVMMKLVDKIEPKKMISAGIGMVGMATAIRILAGAVKFLGQLDMKVLKQGGIALTSLMVALSGMALVLNGMKGIVAAAAGLVILAGALTLMAGAIVLYAAIPLGVIAQGLGAMAVTLIALGLAMSFFPKGMIAKSLGLLVIANAMLVLSASLAILGNLSLATLAKGIITMALALTILVVAANAMTGGLAGAAAMLIMAGAIAILAPALALMGALPMSVIGKGLLVLAAVMAIFVVGMYALTPVIAVMALFSSSLLLLGLAMLAAGTGFGLFVAGLAALTVVGAAGFAVLTAGVISLLALLPLMAQQFGFAVITFVGVIAAAAGKVAEAAGKIVIAFVSEIARRAPEIFSKGLDMIVGFLKAIRDHIGDITRIAADIIVNFLKALTDKLPDIIEAAFKLIIAFINGLADAIKNNAGDLGAAGANLGIAIAEGMVKGIISAGKKVVGAGKDMAKHLLSGVGHHLGIFSPSREFAKLGMYSALGLAMGFDKNHTPVKKSAAGVADTAVNSMKKSLSALSNITTDNVDVNPTIKPVLDLSGVKADSAHMQKLLAVNPIDVKSTIFKATNASAGITNSQAATAVNALQLKKAADAIAASTAKHGPHAGPRPVEFHIGTIQDGDSLLRRARATNRMLSLAEGGDSPQLERIQ